MERDIDVINQLEHSQKSSVQSWVDGELASAEDKKKRKASRVWYGTSEKDDKDQVKALCRGDEDGPSMATFEFQRRVWGTFSLELVPGLILSNKWHPDGLPRDLWMHAAREAWCRVEKKRMATAKRQHEKVKADTLREQAEEAKRAETAAERLEWQRRMEEQMLSIPPTTEADYAEAQTMGLCRALVDMTATFPHLGPRGGPSTWARVKRWIHLNDLNAHLPTGKSAQQVIEELRAEYAKRCVAREEETQRQAEAAEKRREEEEQRRLRELDADNGQVGQYESFDAYKTRFYQEQATTNGAGAASSTDPANPTDPTDPANPTAPNLKRTWGKTFYIARTTEQEAQWRLDNGLNAILENAKRMAVQDTIRRLLPCPQCGNQPRLVQFLECQCKVGWFDWVWCSRCTTNAHPSKLPCQCHNSSKNE